MDMMAQIIAAFIVVFGVLAYLLYAYTIDTDPHELPKFFGSAFGAAVSSAVVILIFFLTRERDRRKSDVELAKLEKALWLDTWTTLPAVNLEYDYWKKGAQSPSASPGAGYSIKTRDIVIEHLRSMFFEANLTSLPRIAKAAQTHLILFHDNLRIVRERLLQILSLLSALEADRVASANDDSLAMQLTDREHDIAAMINDLIFTLENALVHGWLGQAVLDVERNWRDEFAKRGEEWIWHDGTWVQEVQAIVERYRGGALRIAQEAATTTDRGSSTSKSVTPQDANDVPTT
jgi:hypothetical protein